MRSPRRILKASHFRDVGEALILSIAAIGIGVSFALVLAIMLLGPSKIELSRATDGASEIRSRPGPHDAPQGGAGLRGSQP